MKKANALVAGIALATASGLVQAAGAGNTTLSGNVPDLCGLIVSDFALDIGSVLTGGSAFIDVDIYCNDIDGADVSVASTNGGFSLDDGVLVVPYDVAIAGVTVSGSFNTGTSPNSTWSGVAPGGQALIDGDLLNVTLSTTSTNAQYAGTYSDTLTFTLEAKL